jgi:signal transduction histidine kinase
MQLPLPVLKVVAGQVVAARSPAYLVCDKEGRVNDCGGALERYGLGGVKVGDMAADTAIFLGGMLPVNQASLCIPSVRLGEHCPADVYLGAADNAEWVILLDASGNEAQNGLIQQERNELRLLQERLQSTNAQLEFKNNELEHATQLLTQFVANISHDLRTPLTAIVGYAGLLLNRVAGEVNEKQRKFLEYIDKSANHLVALINDLLDVSKLEAGKLELHMESLPVKNAGEEVLSMIEPQARKKNITIESHMAEGTVVRADPRRFKQVLSNLLSNAVKFTPAGGAVRLDCRGEGKFVRIAVSDTGIGISPQDQVALFRDFFRAGNATVDGTGLGLAITKRLVERHGGTITLTSELGKGSCFVISLPSASESGNAEAEGT